MAESSTFRIITIPPLQNALNPDSTITAFAKKFRELRLRALRVNPEAYASIYETESQRPLDHTLERLSNPQAVHFLAVRSLNSSTASSEDRDENDLSALIKDEWLGFIVLLGPQEDDGSNPRQFGEEPFPTTTVDGQLRKPRGLVYRISGTFVDPAGRGNGLGMKLMDAALKRAKTGVAGEVFGGGNVGVRVGLVVYRHNKAAIGLYQAAGFGVVEERESKSREGWRVVVMENVLAPML